MEVALSAKGQFFTLNRVCGLPGRRDFVQQTDELSQSCSLPRGVSPCGRLRSSRTRLERAHLHAGVPAAGNGFEVWILAGALVGMVASVMRPSR
jgi:hypothetical protein